MSTVLARMAVEEIIAVPVQEGERLTAFFDLSDLLALLFAPEPVNLDTLPVREARNRSGHDVFMSVEPTTGLYTLAEHFSRGVHRVPVMQEGRAVAIASQSALLEFLVRQLGPEPDAPLLAQSCEAAGLTRHAPPLVAEGATLREALRGLHEAGGEAAGLLGPGRGLAGTLDLAALRGLDAAGLRLALEQPAASVAAGRPGKSLTRPASAPVLAVLRDAARLHAHHVFLTDGEGRPAGLVTLSDLVQLAIRAADRHPPKKH